MLIGFWKTLSFLTGKLEKNSRYRMPYRKIGRRGVAYKTPYRKMEKILIGCLIGQITSHRWREYIMAHTEVNASEDAID